MVIDEQKTGTNIDWTAPQLWYSAITPVFHQYGASTHLEDYVIVQLSRGEVPAYTHCLFKGNTIWQGSLNYQFFGVKGDANVAGNFQTFPF